MADFKAFFANNAIKPENERFVVSKRFVDEKGKPIPWELRCLTEAENAELRNRSTKKVKGKTGKYESEMDNSLYMSNLIAASVVDPDLKNAAIQDSYGVKSETSLLQRMLTPGEFAELAQKVQTLNGFDEDPNEVMEEVKN